jgi:hypothetical protein
MDLGALPAGFGVYSDLELMTGAGGKRFLVGLSADYSTMGVLELSDNGMLITGSITIALGTNLSNGTYSLTSMEFAAADIPEPTTLLLLGTGALGAFGYVRRRRMK